MKPLLLIIFIVLFCCILFCAGIFIVIHNETKDVVKTTDEKYDRATLLKYKPVESERKLKILILQIESYKKSIPEYGKISAEINSKYASKWGYTYLLKKHDYNEAPPYWLRVKDLKDNLPNYDVVMYLDLDAVVVDSDISVESVLDYIKQNEGPGKDILISIDAVPMNINTGVFIVKNTMFSRSFVDMWYNSCFDASGGLTNRCLMWDHSEEKGWKCESCRFADINYEQGSFDHLLPLFQENIAVLPRLFLSNDNPKKSSYVLHLLGKSDSKRLKTFKNLLNR